MTTIGSVPRLIPIPCRVEDCHAINLSTDPEDTYTCPEHEVLRGYQEGWQ